MKMKRLYFLIDLSVFQTYQTKIILRNLAVALGRTWGVYHQTDNVTWGYSLFDSKNPELVVMANIRNTAKKLCKNCIGGLL